MSAHTPPPSSRGPRTTTEGAIRSSTQGNAPPDSATPGPPAPGTAALGAVSPGAVSLGAVTHEPNIVDSSEEDTPTAFRASTVAAVRRGRISRGRRRRLIIAALAALVAVMFLVSLMAGQTFYSFDEVSRSSWARM